ncbi:MAG TPA: hypothetical protein VFE46_15700 [Pirellulales bacterium]|jgi:hypothetical protein|nr:hypothetical protein [Pirellulales bacterium]
MGRRYAAVLGMLAFAAILARGMVAGGAWDSVLSQAIAALFAFAVVGGITGWLAERMIDDSLRSQLNAELGAKPASNVKPSTAARQK